MIEYIREIIARKGILFQTKSGKPYLVNACCEELLAYPPRSVMEYFKNEDAAIAKIVDLLHNLTRKIATHQEKQKAWILSKEKNIVQEKESDTSSSPSEKKNPIFSYEPSIFYAALIHYAKLGSEIYPIPADLESIVSKKPKDWMNSLSMPEKIDLLEKQQLRTDARKTIALMNIVNQRHPVSILTSIDISPKNRIQMAITSFAEKNADIPFVDHITRKWLEQSEEIDFEKENGKMQKEWFSFMERNAKKKPTNAVVKKMTKFIYDWDSYREIPLSNLVMNQKSILYRIGILFPSYLHSNLDVPKIPKHWELIISDVIFLKKQLQTYKTNLKSFQKNEYLMPIYQNLVERIQPLMDFMEYALLDASFDKSIDKILDKSIDQKSIDQSIDQKSIDKGGDKNKDTDKNKRTDPDSEEKKRHFFELSLFCMHLCWMIYIGLIENPNIYRIITKKIRENTQEKIDENRFLSENGEDEEEEDEDLEEVNITTVQIENKSMIQQKTADLFLAIIDTLKTKAQINVKEPVMMSYADIMREIDYSKDREKQKIKKYFTDMSVEERKAELVLKKLHLGIFAIDSKKLNKYGKNTGLFGDRDIIEPRPTTEEDMKEDEIDDSVEYQNMIREEEADPEREIFEEEEDDDLNDFFGTTERQEDDYEDMNEYAYENMNNTEYD